MEFEPIAVGHFVFILFRSLACDRFCNCDSMFNLQIWILVCPPKPRSTEQTKWLQQSLPSDRCPIDAFRSQRRRRHSTPNACPYLPAWCGTCTCILMLGLTPARHYHRLKIPSFGFQYIRACCGCSYVFFPHFHLCATCYIWCGYHNNYSTTCNPCTTLLIYHPLSYLLCLLLSLGEAAISSRS